MPGLPRAAAVRWHGLDARRGACLRGRGQGVLGERMSHLGGKSDGNCRGVEWSATRASDEQWLFRAQLELSI